MEEKQIDPRDMVLKELKRSTKYFLEYMKEYADRQPPTTIAHDQWDTRQLIEHVILADKSILSLLHQPFDKEKTGHFTKYHMRDLMLNRRRKLKSQKRHQPHKTMNKSWQELLDEFQYVREDIIAQVEQGEFDLLSDKAYPHHTLGLLTRRDWLYMLCFHSDRHIAQTQELLFVS